MNPYAIHAADVGSLETEMGSDCPGILLNPIVTNDVPHGGTPYNVIPGSAAHNAPLRVGGFSQVYDLTITLTVAQFNLSVPGLNALLLAPPALVLYTGVLYKVANIHILSGATLIRLALNSLNENA